MSDVIDKRTIGWDSKKYGHPLQTRVWTCLYFWETHQSIGWTDEDRQESCERNHRLYWGHRCPWTGIRCAGKHHRNCARHFNKHRYGQDPQIRTAVIQGTVKRWKPEVVESEKASCVGSTLSLVWTFWLSKIKALNLQTKRNVLSWRTSVYDTGKSLIIILCRNLPFTCEYHQ